MRLHENDCFATRHEKQYALGGHKKTPSAAKCSEGAAADKKRTRHQAALLHRPVACL